MIYEATNQVLENIISHLKKRGWNAACNAVGVQLENGKVVANPAQAGRELSYIGIEDNKGTYIYFRDNSNSVNLSPENIGACEKGVTASREIRAVAVSNNLQNTAQLLADKMFSDIVSAPKRNTPLAYDIRVIPRGAYDVQGDIYAAETGAVIDGHRANRVVLAAFDFALEFSVNTCNLPNLKIC